MAPLRPLHLSGGRAKMHASTFTYSIARPYPFKWFTPVVFLGCIVFLALFSIINYISTGYQMVVVQSSNPNATIQDNPWMRHWPSFFTSKVQPTCETVNLALGSEWFTNQTALTYTLTDVWQPDDGGAGAGYGVAPSLTYSSNVIEDCRVNSVEIDYAAMDRTAIQMAYSPFGAVVRTYTTCSIIGVNGTTNFNLTNEYDYVPSDLSFSGLYTFLGTNFLSRNQTSKSSLWWGESLMSMYWAFSNAKMQTIADNQTSYKQPAIRKGTLYFYPNDDSQTTNMTDPSFFECDFRFVVDKGQGAYDFLMPTTYGEYRQYTSLSNLIASEAYPNIWQEADVLAKAAYSTVLTDLGQVNAPSNILTDPGLLSYFTANFSETRHSIANAYPGPADQQYDTLFLRRHPERNYCEGCMEQPRTTSNMYRETSPGPGSRYSKEDPELEMGGLRPSARSTEFRRSGSQSRSVSQQRLIPTESIDIGGRQHRY
ncbi:hypothetical protein LTR91_014866 [Friedmanniomyces endolithicus]|uniref:Uncharacterized protein n=1 Tax=Friedmanniomyces endolithicus TaxID=329885 RepID=A0AAN6QMY5_9PEZI|nr:hypothetical protein LTR94_000411 [Friedmanniomyces endolithicus]KAK0788579.1 hypothetical protein LTR59_009969 [Friedmanniomyces endolithicus]KAK0802737.1 hypothetical protein LTR38_006433 [Friedmanniomyces endolithicus]KAK0808514.1 hypothetical protein LTR75_006221 [Friedmanniomyces endolithicus]KAK0849189.1 hypothetical protein LTS02_013708 [Friedmanniomyces endolithicus]